MVQEHESVARRHQRLESGPDLGIRSFEDRTAGPEREAASREAGQLVVTAMDRLSVQDRALVTMRYREGLTDLEVGEAVGMNRNTVRTRLRRAR